MWLKSVVFNQFLSSDFLSKENAPAGDGFSAPWGLATGVDNGGPGVDGKGPRLLVVDSE